MRYEQRRVLPALVLACAAAAAAQTPPAPKAPEEYSGLALYGTYCTSCHGPAAKGDGPLAERLRFRPADLTRIAKRNKGQWDAERVARLIDGRNPVKGHAAPDMPLWGDAFKNSHDGYDEASVKAKVEALVVYLESLQEPEDKPRE